MTHNIPENVRNGNIEYCISEYVRLERDRDILRDHWFGGLSFMALSEKYKISDDTVKRVIYGQGDKILIKAAKMR